MFSQQFVISISKRFFSFFLFLYFLTLSTEIVFFSMSVFRLRMSFYFSGFFEKSLKFFNAHPEISMCSGNFSLFKDKQPYHFQKVELLSVDTPRLFTPQETTALYRSSRFRIASQSTIYRREAVLRFGGYKSSLQSLSDFYLNCQIAFRYAWRYLPETFSAFRIMDYSYSESIHKQIETCKILQGTTLNLDQQSGVEAAQLEQIEQWRRIQI